MAITECPPKTYTQIIGTGDQLIESRGLGFYIHNSNQGNDLTKAAEGFAMPSNASRIIPDGTPIWIIPAQDVLSVKVVHNPA